MILNPLAILADIRLGKQGIEFLILRYFVIATIRYENIAVVHRQTNLVSPLTAYRFVNRFGRRYVIDKKTSWFSKHVVVSPANGDEFERKLRSVGARVEA